MRKFYSLVAFVAMMLVSLTASAWGYTMTDENAVLQSEAYNYRLFKCYDFTGAKFAGEPMADDAGNPVSGDGCFGLSADKAAFKVNGFDAFQVLSPACMNNFFIQIGTSAINLRGGVGKDGLHNYGSGSRFFAVADVKAGQIIACEWALVSDAKGTEALVQPSAAISGADACEFTDITDEIHAAQQEAGIEPQVYAPLSQYVSYWRAETDGYFVVEMQRNTAIMGIQIWIDASAAEAVTSPALKVVGVNNDARKIEFKTGESTFGNETKTFYSIGGGDPIFMKETDEIVGYDYIYGEDGEKEDSVPVYKKILDRDLVEEYGTYGDIEFDPADEFVTVTASDDEEDGVQDGIVIIKAAAVSIETGAVSDVVTVKVSVSEIELNAPALSLVGMDGTKRTYSVAWTNNTLCGEDFQIILENDEGYYEELEVNTIADVTVSGTSVVKASVKVEGYATGSAEKEVDAKGIDVKRKASVVADEDGNAVHDWDFVKITDEQQQIIRGEVIESCYIIVENGEQRDSLVYTAEEYINGESKDGVDLSAATPNYAPSCWWWDGSRTRATLNVVSAEDGYEGNISDPNANGYGYVDDTANIFNGLNISCPPNANNASCIFMYINGDLGAYFMSRPTITFPREAAAAGEYVMFYIGQGGSNYTNTRYPVMYEVPTGELLSVTLPSGGVHVFYIDVYTYDNLPADEYDPTAVKAPMTSGIQKIAGYYSINGARLAAPQKGINIVKYADGTTMKVLVK